MKFSTEWFKKWLPFGRKPADALAEEEIASASTEAAENEDTAVEKPGFRKRLMGLFKRKQHTPAGDDGEAVEDSETEKTVVAAQAGEKDSSPLEEAEQVEGKAAFWKRLAGLFRKKPKGDEHAGADEAAADAGEGGETSEKGWRVRLSRIFKRKSGSSLTADTADAAELFSWGEGEGKGKAAPIAAGKSGKDKKEEKAGAAQTDAGEHAADEEEPPAPGFGARVGALLKKKIVWISLVLLLVATATGVVLFKLRAHEQAKMQELEKKYQQLQEENRKLQAARKKNPDRQPSRPAGQPASPPAKASGAAGAAGQDSPDKAASGDDCTVNNKASAAEALKKCIDNFNAMDRR